MTLSHRPLDDKDAHVISAFASSEDDHMFSFPKAPYPLTPQFVLDAAHKRESPMVVLLNEDVVGYANFIQTRPNLFCTLGNLVVNPLFRRQGVATYLVNTMVALAVDMYGARFVRAACFSHNTAGYQLYRGMGFKPLDMVHRTSPVGETVLLVNMELACYRK